MYNRFGQLHILGIAVVQVLVRQTSNQYKHLYDLLPKATQHAKHVNARGSGGMPPQENFEIHMFTSGAIFHSKSM